MSDVVERLRKDFKDQTYRHTYDEGFLSSSIATQIKTLREQRGWTQAELAQRSKMNQSRISELEDVNFNSWTIRTLRKLCRAFDLRLKISFEEFGTLLDDFRRLNRQSLSRQSFAYDPAFQPLAGVDRFSVGSSRNLRIGRMREIPDAQKDVPSALGALAGQKGEVIQLPGSLLVGEIRHAAQGGL